MAWRALVLSWFVGLVGCPSDLCGDGQSATNAVANKFASCAAQDPGFFGGFSPCFDVNACEADLKACTAADRSGIQAAIGCQNAFASNDDCSFAGLSTLDDCVSGATDAGTALTAACAAQFAPQSQGSCGPADGG